MLQNQKLLTHIQAQVDSVLTSNKADWHKWPSLLPKQCPFSLWYYRRTILPLMPPVTDPRLTWWLQMTLWIIKTATTSKTFIFYFFFSVYKSGSASSFLLSEILRSMGMSTIPLCSIFCNRSMYWRGKLCSIAPIIRHITLLLMAKSVPWTMTLWYAPDGLL